MTPRPWQRLLRTAWTVRGPYLASLVLLLLISALTAAKAWIIRPAGDALFGEDTTPADWTPFCLIALGIFLAQGVLNYAYAILARVAASGIVLRIRATLCRTLIARELGFFLSTTSGDLTSRVVNDVAQVENAAVFTFQRLLRDGLTAAFLLGVMLWQDARLTAACVGLFAVLLVLLALTRARVRRLSRHAQEVQAAVVHQLGDILRGIEVVLSFVMGERWARRLDALHDEHRRAEIRLESTTALASSAAQVLVGVGIVVTLYLSGMAVLRGEITRGQFLSFLSALFLLQTPLADIGKHYVALTRGLAAADRAFELLDDDAAAPGGAALLPAVGPLEVTFDGVSFRYGDAAVLDDVTFDVAAGEFVAMIGESGEGKTTLARLLLGLHDPNAGAVAIGGVPLADADRRRLFERVAYVAQSVHLFSSTIRENLVLGHPDAGDEDLSLALRRAGLTEWVDALPDGLETPIGELGTRLSGGQRQRIALARALLTRPGLLVLDEATSAVDPELEADVLRGLATLRGETTVFAISHRPAVAVAADRVLRLADGRVEETLVPARS